MIYDVIVAGAGPAGSATARLLARGGASVLLLDRQRFPRDKPCGGGVTLRAAGALDADISPIVERTIYGVRFTLRLGPAFERRHDLPLTYMTQRRRLDALLAEGAAEAGADFHDGEPVTVIDFDGAPGAPVTVHTAGGSYAARVLIGADGANGVTGRATGLRAPPPSGLRAGPSSRLRTGFEEAVAIEGKLPFPGGLPAEWDEYVALDLGSLAGGYGWIFPKDGHLNVGVGAWKYAAFTLRPKLAGICHRFGFDPSRLTDLRGHHLPVRMPGTPIARGPIALVGDAAGLVDPLSGEGMHMAFASARLAAQGALAALADGTQDMAAYQRDVDRLLQPELIASRQLHEMLNFAPPPYLAIMRRSRRFWHYFCHLVRGDLTYLYFMRKIGPLRPVVVMAARAAQKHRLAKVARESLLLAGREG